MSGDADPFLFIMTHAEPRSESVNGASSTGQSPRLWSGTTALLRLLRGKEGGKGTLYAATVVVKYKVYVYTSQLTFKQYDYSSSTTPSTRNLTILADSSLGSGSALYHVKYVDGALAYCIQPGVRSDDSSNYVQGSTQPSLRVRVSLSLATCAGAT